MSDQASNLRRLVAERQGPPVAGRRARTLAILSGKGGVGKTNLGVNLALLLGQAGKRVILLDADFGLANVDVLFDVDPPFTIQHVLAGEKEVADCLVPVAEGVRLLPGVSGVARLANLETSERMRLLERFSTLEDDADFLILDTGAGVGDNVIQMAAMADMVMILTVPEPTAITDAYACVKLLARLELPARLGMVVNMVANRPEAQRVVDGLIGVTKRFLGVEPEYWGYVLRDAHVQVAVKRRRPFVLEYPRCPAAVCLRRIVPRLIESSAGVAGGEGLFGRLSSWFR